MERKLLCALGKFAKNLINSNESNKVEVKKKSEGNSKNQQNYILKTKVSQKKKKIRDKNGNIITNPAKKTDDYLFNLVPEQPKAISL